MSDGVIRRSLSVGRGLLGGARQAARYYIAGHRHRYAMFCGSNVNQEVDLVRRAAARGALCEGPDIAAYETEFATKVGCTYGVAFAAGRRALYSLLEAMGIGAGDEVILQAFTCVVVPNALCYRGIRPVFVDIEANTLNMDLDQVEARITPRTRAILLQHTLGRAADCARARDLAHRHGLLVIEDAAHALGAQWAGRPVGAWGDAAYFSTDHSKVINTHVGGMVTTNDRQLADRLRREQERLAYPSPARLSRMVTAFCQEVKWYDPARGAYGPVLAGASFRFSDRGFFLDELHTARPPDYPLRLANFQAIVGRHQLTMLDENIRHRREIARTYDAVFGQYTAELAPDCASHIFVLYTFLVKDRAVWERALLPVRQPGVWFETVCAGRSRDLELVGYQTGSCPRAEFAAVHCMNLPTHPRVTRPDLLLPILRRLHQDSPIVARANRHSVGI